MEKKYIVTLGYQAYVARDKQHALDVLELEPVQRDYVNNETVYTPHNQEIIVVVVDPAAIRPLTPVETENQALKDLESRNKWITEDREKLTKERDDLKQQLKAALGEPVS